MTSPHPFNTSNTSNKPSGGFNETNDQSHTKGAADDSLDDAFDKLDGFHSMSGDGDDTDDESLDYYSDEYHHGNGRRKYKSSWATFDGEAFKKSTYQCLEATWAFLVEAFTRTMYACNGSLLKTAVINAYRSWPLFGIFTLLFLIFFISTLSTIDVDFDGTELQNASAVASAIRKGLILTLFDAFFLSSLISMVAYEYMIIHNTNRDPNSNSDPDHEGF